MSDPRKENTGTKTGRKHQGQKTPVLFYGGLKSKHEIYFQMASVFKEATRGRHSLPDEWMGRIMALQETNTSGKFF